MGWEQTQTPPRPPSSDGITQEEPGTSAETYETLEASPKAPASGAAWSRHYRRILVLSDTVAITIALMATSLTLAASGRASATGSGTSLLLTALFVFVVWESMMALFRTRDSRVVGVGAGEYKRVVRCCAATAGLLAVAVLIVDGAVGREYIFLTVPLGGLLVLFSRWGWRQWLTRERKYGHYLSRVVVLGQAEDVRYVIRQITTKSGAAYEVVGAVLDGDAHQTMINTGTHSVPVIGAMDHVADAVGTIGADAVVVAGHLSRGSAYVRELGWKLESTSTELVLASSLTNVAGPRIHMRPVEGLPLMHVELPYFTGGRHIAKRAVDILVSGLALVILTPLLISLGLLIKKGSPGDALFCQQRVGRQGDTFRMYKFRSMVESAEQALPDLVDGNEGAGPLFKMKHDPRITRIGAWLRKFSLDELPQFYNVLRGDMSLVGPRPPLPREVADYQGHVHRRLFIKPGITGLWQVNGRSDLDWEESVRLDLYYVENWSITGDLMIMWRTVKVMLKHEGAY
ncbi:sugar transferase [Arthrobacter castelli]|uniref:sugar transferase n=1 Tax=Arthrobacter castelli TaxID=271431 RepID=UPI0003F50927|nr:sugar transferase [Arthrobacter castelli]